MIPLIITNAITLGMLHWIANRYKKLQKKLIETEKERDHFEGMVEWQIWSGFFGR